MKTGRRHPRPGTVISPRRRCTDWRAAQKSPTVRPPQRPPHRRAKLRNRDTRYGTIRPAGERRDGAHDIRTSPAAPARNVHGGHLRQRRAAVHGAADVHQDGAAAPGRRAVGVVGGDRVLPGRVAGGLCLRPLAHALRAGPRVDRRPSRGDGRRRVRAAAVDRHRLGATAGVRRNVMADGPVRGLDRLAVLRPRRQQPVAAGVVRAHRSSGRERPLFPLRRQQYRKLPRTRVLSERDRTIRGAAATRPGSGRSVSAC